MTGSCKDVNSFERSRSLADLSLAAAASMASVAGDPDPTYTERMI